MSTETEQEIEMVSVPKTVLQDLIWNIQLGATSIREPTKCDEMVEEQCDELQGYVNGEGYIDPNEGFSLEGYENVEFVDFRKRKQ